MCSSDQDIGLYLGCLKVRIIQRSKEITAARAPAYFLLWTCAKTPAVGERDVCLDTRGWVLPS